MQNIQDKIQENIKILPLTTTKDMKVDAEQSFIFYSIPLIIS